MICVECKTTNNNAPFTFSNSMSPMAVITSPPVMVFLLHFCAAAFAEEVAYNTKTLAAWNQFRLAVDFGIKLDNLSLRYVKTYLQCKFLSQVPSIRTFDSIRFYFLKILTLAMAALASFETLQVFGRQSLIILVTIDVGRFRSSGLSAIFRYIYLSDIWK